jgi:tRNA1Val (adenine37-N6)-methyltransferase
MEHAPGPAETLDRFVGDWSIFQLRRGHRYSTDDLVCAWRAAFGQPDARRLLDLGCGIGTVGLATLWRLGAPHDATLDGIEAQEVRLGLGERVRIHHADLRDAPPQGVQPGSYDLVTGSPPYVPLGKGLVSPNPQRAGARSELRGSVFDYCRAARRYLAPGGRFCFVMAAADPRTEQAPKDAGLRVLERWDFVFREGRDPHISTLLCARAEDVAEAPRDEGRLVVRGADGEWTAEYTRFRSAMGAQEPSRGPRSP